MRQNLPSHSPIITSVKKKQQQKKEQTRKDNNNFPAKSIKNNSNQFKTTGWKYSRLGEVIVHHVSKSGRVDSRSAVLVDNAGCRDARMRSVCPDNPIQVSPLVTTLAVKAFMFQGMDNGDEMIMSVRTIGCLLQEDCYKVNSYFISIFAD